MTLEEQIQRLDKSSAADIDGKQYTISATVRDEVLESLKELSQLRELLRKKIPFEGDCKEGLYLCFETEFRHEVAFRADNGDWYTENGDVPGYTIPIDSIQAAINLANKE